MKLITRSTDYALRALCYVAKKKEVVAVAELVKALGIPRPFLRKILQQLNKEGILESHKGQRGGFKLKVASSKIHITDIMRIFQGQAGLDSCFLKKTVCPNRSKCVLRKKLHLIEGSVSRQFQKISIASLI